MNYPEALTPRHDMPLADPVAGAAAGVEAIDPRAVLALLRRHAAVIGAILAVSALLGVATILLSTPRYRAVASIQIDQRATRVLGTEDVDPIESGTEADRFLQTQVDVLTSRWRSAWRRTCGSSPAIRFSPRWGRRARARKPARADARR